MMLRRSLAAGLLLLFCLCASASRMSPVVEAVKRTQGAVVTIRAAQKKGTRLGSGVVIDERGAILTCKHVLGKAKIASVRLHDGSSHEAKVKAKVPSMDLVVLEIDAGRPLQALSFAPASDLMVGETVIAIGAPFGASDSVCTGIISGLERTVVLPSGEEVPDTIQTSLPLNSGNSGGPLLNIMGELIGLQFAINGKGPCIAFALNADQIQDELVKLLGAAEVAGVQHGLTLAVDVAQRRAVVAEIACPACAADVAVGDLLEKVGDRQVYNRFDVERALWDATPEQTVKLRILRNGETREIGLTLKKRE